MAPAARLPSQSLQITTRLSPWLPWQRTLDPQGATGAAGVTPASVLGTVGGVTGVSVVYLQFVYRCICLRRVDTRVA